MEALWGIQAKILKVPCTYGIKLPLQVISVFLPFIHMNLIDEWLQHQNSVSSQTPPQTSGKLSTLRLHHCLP